MQRYLRESERRLTSNRAHFTNNNYSFGKRQLLHSDRDVHLMKAKCGKKDGGFAFQFEFPDSNGLSLHSVSLSIKDNTPMLTFEAANPFDSPSLTEQDVAVMAKLAMEGRRPEFAFIALPPGHLLHGRQYKQYSPSWIKGTSIGDLLFEADWAMKCLSIGSKSNKEKTKFCSRQKTSKLPNLATKMDFPSCKRAGSIFMSCKSVTVEETDECLMFVGDPVMAITSDVTPAYGDYITAHYDSVAYYDEPLFLKMKELIKLILGMEWLVKKGVKFNQKWISRHVNKPPQSQAVQLYQGKSLHVKELARPLFTQFPFGLGISPITPDHVIDMFCNPKMPISLQPVIIPDVETWPELYNETVPWPKITELNLHKADIRSSLGGISTSSIPVTRSRVAATPTYAAEKSRNQSTTPYTIEHNKVKVKASQNICKTTNPLPRRGKPTKKEYKVPSKDITHASRTVKACKTFGTSDSNKLFSESGEELHVSKRKNRLTSQGSEPTSLASPSHGTAQSELMPPLPLSASPMEHETISKPPSPTSTDSGYGMESFERNHLTSQGGDEPTLTHDSSPAMEVGTSLASPSHTAQSELMPPLLSSASPMEHETVSKPPSPTSTDSGYGMESLERNHLTSQGGDEPTLTRDTSSPPMEIPLASTPNSTRSEAELKPLPTSLNISPMEHETASTPFSPTSTDSGYSTESFNSTNS